MQLVVEIDEKKYASIKKCLDSGMELDAWQKAVANGIPLPKGHGRLIDEDAIKKYIEDGAICHKCVGNGWGCEVDCTFPDSVDYKMEKMLKEQETIIEADKEGAEE